MQVFVKVLRISTVLVVAAISITAVNAQTDNDSDSSSRTSCSDVKPPAVNTQDRVDNIPIYRIQPDQSGHRATCRATEALAEGMVDVELGEDHVLADATGDPRPTSDVGEVSEFPVVESGSRATPGMPPPGPGPERHENSHVYAVFVDPSTGVEYTFSSVADSMSEAESAGVDWVKSTVGPLLKQRTRNASAQSSTEATFVAADVIEPAAASQTQPTFNPLAWKLVLDGTVSMPDNKLARGFIREFGKEFDKPLGRSGLKMRVYRLNATVEENEYFLVDTGYTQTPAFEQFSFHAFPFIAPILISAWANDHTIFALTASDPNHPSTQVYLDQFAPQTVNSSNNVTFKVGGTLSVDATGPSGEIRGDYEVTREQLDVDTVLKATIGSNSLEWTDTYSIGALFTTPPATLTNTFTGERLAIFKVPRSINDDIPQGKLAGLDFIPNLESHMFGVVTTQAILINNTKIFASWGIKSLLFVPEPHFGVTLDPAAVVARNSIQVSKSKNDINHPVFINVNAELQGGAAKVPWHVVTPQFIATDLGSGIRRGSLKLKVIPTNAAQVGNAGFILLDSDPSGATDSLRNGAISIAVKIVP